MRVHVPDRRFHVFVELISDEGLSGWGSAYSEMGQAVGALGWVRRFVVGENALEIERVTEKLHEVSFWLGRGGAMTHAISAVNLALWDLAGRALGLSAATMLGGARRESVPSYASVLFTPLDNLESRLTGLLAKGFRGIKLGWHPFGTGSMKDDEALVSRARAAVGDDVALMIDAGGSSPFWPHRYKDALERARMLADHGVAWYEEPLAPDDIEGYARLTDVSPTKIAHGEVLTRRQSFMPYLTRRAMDIAQPDATKVGGLSEMRRIAWLAELHGVEVVPHGWNTALGVAADLALTATLPGHPWVEFNVGNRLVEEIAESPFALDDQGQLPVPQAPGLGVTVDVSRLKELEESGYTSETWTWDETMEYEVR